LRIRPAAIRGSGLLLARRSLKLRGATRGGSSASGLCVIVVAACREGQEIRFADPADQQSAAADSCWREDP